MSELRPPNSPFHGATVVQKGKRKCKCLKIKHLHFLVPGAGIEPARIAPLVFETSASTDSAIRAGGRMVLPIGSAKVLEFSEIAK